MKDATAGNNAGDLGASQAAEAEFIAGQVQRRLSIDSVVRNVAAITAGFYVLGFLTTNAYLYKLGVPDFSLFRTRFILTGALTMAPLAVALIWGVYAAVDLTVFGSPRHLPRRAYFWLGMDVVIPFLLYFFLFVIATDNDTLTSARDAALLTVACAIIVLAMLVSLAIYRASQGHPLSYVVNRGQPFNYGQVAARLGVPGIAIETFVFVVAGIVLLLLYVGFFGQQFYGTIPEQFGGGRPRSAQFLFAQESLPSARQLGLEVTADEPLSAPLQLLWEGEQTFVIRLPAPRDRTIVQIPRDLVDGVITGETLAPPTSNGST